MAVLSQAEITKRLQTSARLTSNVKVDATAVRLIQSQPEPSDVPRSITLTSGRSTVVGERKG